MVVLHRMRRTSGVTLISANTRQCRPRTDISGNCPSRTESHRNILSRQQPKMSSTTLSLPTVKPNVFHYQEKESKICRSLQHTEVSVQKKRRYITQPGHQLITIPTGVRIVLRNASNDTHVMPSRSVHHCPSSGNTRRSP